MVEDTNFLITILYTVQNFKDQFQNNSLFLVECLYEDIPSKIPTCAMPAPMRPAPRTATDLQKKYSDIPFIFNKYY